MNNEFNNQSNQGESNVQQVISVEKKKTNIVAVLGLVLAFFVPIIGLILSIIGLSHAKKIDDGKGIAIGGIVTSVLMLILQMLFIAIFIFILLTDNSFVNDYRYDENDDNYYGFRESFDYSSELNEDGKFYIVKNEDRYYSKYSYSEEYELVATYECESIFCNVFDASSEYAIVYDNKYYFLYDYRNNKKIGLNIEYQKYHSLYLYDDNNSNTVGIFLTDEKYRQAYYDIKKEKILIDFGEYKDIRVKSEFLSAGYISVSNDNFSNDKRLFNIAKEKVEIENILGVFSNNKVTYFYDGEFSGEDGISKIYSSDLKLIVDLGETCYNYYFSQDGKLSYSKDKKFYIIENNKINYTSKSYNEVYNVIKDYVVVNKDNDLVILDYKENEVANLVKLTDNLVVHDMLSGWYTENGKNGIYVVVSDNNVTCYTVDRSLLEKYYEGTYQEAVLSCDDNSGQFGYEYYYIPSTKETGKIETLIGMYAKPLLYLYPENDNTNVRVSFENSKLLTTTYPKYNKYWNVVANKNGDLYDENGRYYYGLYWEELGSTKVDFSECFYVEGDNAINFLEEKLEILGFTEREANEFITYWLPILEKNEKNLVYFELTEEREKFNKLNIDPQPDSMLRVAIHIKKVSKKVDIKEQKLSTFKRHGFTVVEWGGVIH